MKNRVASMLVLVCVDGDGIARNSGCRVWARVGVDACAEDHFDNHTHTHTCILLGLKFQLYLHAV